MNRKVQLRREIKSTKRELEEFLAELPRDGGGYDLDAYNRIGALEQKIEYLQDKHERLEA